MAGINQRASNAKTFFTDKNIRTMLGAFNTKPAYLIDVKPGQSRDEQIANVAKLQAIRESAGDGNKYNEAEVNEKMEALNDYLEKKAEFDSHMRGAPSSDYEKALGYFNEKFDTSVVETYENARTELVDYQIASLKDKNVAKQAHPDAAYAAGDMSRADYTKTVGKIFQKDTSVENVNSKPEKTNTSPSPTQPSIDSVTENLDPKPLDPTMIGSITENLGPKPLNPTMDSVTENLDPHPIQGQDFEPLGETFSELFSQYLEKGHKGKDTFDSFYTGITSPDGQKLLEAMCVEPDAVAAVKDTLTAIHNMPADEYEHRTGTVDIHDMLRGALSHNGIQPDNAINRANEFIDGKAMSELSVNEGDIQYQAVMDARNAAIKDAVNAGETPNFGWMDDNLHTAEWSAANYGFEETAEHPAYGHDPEIDLDKVREQFANMDLHSKESFDTFYEGLNTPYGKQMLELMAVEPDAIAAVKDSLDVLHNMPKDTYEQSIGGDFSDTLRGVLSANGISPDGAMNRVNEFMAGKDPAELLSGKDLGVHYNEMLEAQQKSVKEAVAEGKTPDSGAPEFNWMSGIHTDKYWSEKLSFSETKEHTLGHKPETMNIDHKDEIVEQITKDNPDIIPSKDSGKVSPGTTLEALYGEKAHTLPNIPKIANIDEIVTPEANTQSGKPSKTFDGANNSVATGINAVENVVTTQSEPTAAASEVAADKAIRMTEHDSISKDNSTKTMPSEDAAKTEAKQAAREAAAAAIAPAESKDAAMQFEN